MLQLRDYQKDIANRAAQIINKHGYVYLAMEVRTGKTLTSLTICEKIGAHNVLFLTKKKAISSITADMDKMCPSFAAFVINYESIHKVPDIQWDAIILDEAHGMGAFPKPSKRAKDVRSLIERDTPAVILLSGTPTPESYSQMYHQVYGIPTNPFKEYKSFYKFAKKHVDVRQKKINSMLMNDYSRGLPSIMEAMQDTTISFSQKNAGFVNTIKETVHHVELNPQTYILADTLKRHLVVQGTEETILADTPVKLMQKLHQIYSGTIIFEGGKSMVLDTAKAEYILSNFMDKKIGIFYKFKEELNAIKSVFRDLVTTDLSVFEYTDCPAIALQIVSGREGISLRQADALVYYNIDFSATSYWQSRDRMTTKDRNSSDIHWIFSMDGIEDNIYKAVTKKKDYTLSHFKKDLK